MSLDPYSACPCGSEKKLKFCCIDIAADMLKALQLYEGGQARAAIKILEKLYAQQPSRAWVATSLAGVWMHLQDPAQARETLIPLLQANPDHPLGRILDASAAFDLLGFEAARKVIHRAFTKGAKTHPEMVGSLAAGIASNFYLENNIMAARQHLTLAMRLIRDEDRQSIFMQLLDLDGEHSVPYPLRGVHNLRLLELAEVDQDDFKKALRLSHLGCWFEAAAVLEPLTAKYPDLAELWYNLGLFRAWDGDQVRAAEMFHKAATLAQDREFAISSETLAQVLDLENDRTPDETQYFSLSSVARVLTRLDDVPQFVRESVDPRNPRSDGNRIRYMILDRTPVPVTEPPTSSDDMQKLAVVIGTIDLQDRDPDDPESVPGARITVVPGKLTQVQVVTSQYLGDLLQPVEVQDDDVLPGFSIWSDYAGLILSYFPGEGTLPHLMTLVEKLKWQDITEKDWFERPLQGLNGLTPQQASERPEMACQLAAAINVFDCVTDSHNFLLDREAIRARVGLPPAEPYEIENDNQINLCEVLEMLRIPVETLSESRLELLINRAQLIGHSRFNDRLITSLLKFPHLLDQQRMAQVLHAYIDLARNQLDRQTALDRIELARRWAQDVDQKFEETLQWELRELQFRITNPEDPEFQPFLLHLHQKFLRKLPELESMLSGLLRQQGITPPWEADGTIMTGSSVAAGGGLWSPNAPAAAPAPGKLWLPGQD